MRPADPVALTPGKRILFLTKDPELVGRQLRGELDLRMADVRVQDLMDDINTDAMTPAWACFDYRPEDLARNAYAGITVDGQRLFPEASLLEGNFEVIVSGARKGVGSSRETAPQAERWSGIRIVVAESFSPIYARNCLNLGLLLADHAVLLRLEAGERVPLSEFTRDYDATTRAVILHGGLFPFTRAVERNEVRVPAPAHAARPMTIAEKILARHVVGARGPVAVRPGDAVCVRVDGGYSHEFTTAQVHYFIEQEDGPDYRAANPSKFAVFEDHLIYADGVARMAPYSGKIQVLRDMQRAFQAKTGVRDYSASDGVSPGICHTVARERFIEPGDLIQATDSHTTMGGSVGALAWGVGATEYAALIRSGITFVEVPETVRFDLGGELAAGVTAKDVMLHILSTHARRGDTLGRVLEFGGPGLATMSPDERAVLANMATECSARTGVVEVDDRTLTWMVERRPGTRIEDLRAKVVEPDVGATYAATFSIDLSALRPMVATPGDISRGIPSDPTNGALIADLGQVPIQIAYGGSCTAGKEDDLDQYAAVMREALDAGLRVRDGVDFYIQFGSRAVEDYARKKGYVEVFEKTGVRLIQPGCGACIGCGPGVSANTDQVTVSAINRNYQNRSGPGKLYLASPLSVAASAVEGRIVAYEKGMFSPTS